MKDNKRAIRRINKNKKDRKDFVESNRTIKKTQKDKSRQEIKRELREYE